MVILPNFIRFGFAEASKMTDRRSDLNDAANIADSTGNAVSEMQHSEAK
jgi:hypothetical protein